MCVADKTFCCEFGRLVVASHRQSVEFAAGLITFGGVFVALPSKREATVGSASSSMLLAVDSVGSDERRVCADTSNWPA